MAAEKYTVRYKDNGDPEPCGSCGNEEAVPLTESAYGDKFYCVFCHETHLGNLVRGPTSHEMTELARGLIGAFHILLRERL